MIFHTKFEKFLVWGFFSFIVHVALYFLTVETLWNKKWRSEEKWFRFHRCHHRYHHRCHDDVMLSWLLRDDIGWNACDACDASIGAEELRGGPPWLGRALGCHGELHPARVTWARKKESPYNANKCKRIMKRITKRTKTRQTIKKNESNKTKKHKKSRQKKRTQNKKNEEGKWFRTNKPQTERNPKHKRNEIISKAWFNFAMVHFSYVCDFVVYVISTYNIHMLRKRHNAKLLFKQHMRIIQNKMFWRYIVKHTWAQQPIGILFTNPENSNMYVTDSIYTYIHTYIHTCIHTYRHTYIHTYIKI